MSGTLIRIDPSDLLTIERWDGAGYAPLEQLQKLVGGYIERVRVRFNGRVRDAYLDEEGLIKCLPHNPRASLLASRAIGDESFIVGPLVIWVPDPKQPRKWLRGRACGPTLRRHE